MDNRHVVIFDGVCNFCNGVVTFIINRDPAGIFAFVPMQSRLAHELMNRHNINTIGMDTFLLIKNEQCFVFSSAALEISKDLTGFWYVFTVLKIFPSRFRDFFYKTLARNRYKLFGKQENCLVPDEEVKSRFIGI
jgi:predicted DCC family thiol-disulfide oxidoreductase YuxK